MPGVECVRDRRELLIGVPSRQVRALRGVLAKEPIRVLLRAPLPGAVGIGEEDP